MKSHITHIHAHPLYNSHTPFHIHVYKYHLLHIHAMYSNIYMPLTHCIYMTPNVLDMHAKAQVTHTTYAHTPHTLKNHKSRIG